MLYRYIHIVRTNKSTLFICSLFVPLLLCSDVSAAATWCYSHTAVAILGETWKSLRLFKRDHMEIYSVQFTLPYVQNLPRNLHRSHIPAAIPWHYRCLITASTNVQLFLFVILYIKTNNSNKQAVKILRTEPLKLLGHDKYTHTAILGMTTHSCTYSDTSRCVSHLYIPTNRIWD